MSTTREQSKLNWTGSNDFESVNTGSFQRIADAVEKMTDGFNAVLKEREDHKAWRERYRTWWDEEKKKVAARDRQIASLRGQITKLRKRLAVSNG